MCNSLADGGDRCDDWKRLSKLPAEGVAPDPRDDGVPLVSWADPDSPAYCDMAELWKNSGGGDDRAALCAAVKRLSADREVEPEITTALLDSLPEGTELAGLSARMKSPGSTARKVNARAHSVAARRAADALGMDVCGYAASQMKDTIRYTVRADDHDSLVAVAESTVARLQERGLEVVEADSTYGDGAPYKGLHTTILRPDGTVRSDGSKGGTRFELQFHSRLSLEVKEGAEADHGQGGIHKHYEVYRDVKNLKTRSDQIRFSEAYDECVRQSDAISTPTGLGALKSLGGCVVEKVYRETPEWYLELDQRYE